VHAPNGHSKDAAVDAKRLRSGLASPRRSSRESARAASRWGSRCTALYRGALPTPLIPTGFSGADLARAVDRDPKDKTVRDALDELADEGLLERGEDALVSRAPEPRSTNSQVHEMKPGRVIFM
jgi:hypothetical protein